MNKKKYCPVFLVGPSPKEIEALALALAKKPHYSIIAAEQNNKQDLFDFDHSPDSLEDIILVKDVEILEEDFDFKKSFTQSKEIFEKPSVNPADRKNKYCKKSYKYRY